MNLEMFRNLIFVSTFFLVSTSCIATHSDESEEPSRGVVLKLEDSQIPDWPMFTKTSIKPKLALINPPILYGKKKKRPMENCLGCVISTYNLLERNVLKPAAPNPVKVENILVSDRHAILLDEAQADGIVSRPHIIEIDGEGHPFINVDAPPIIAFIPHPINTLQSVFENMPLQKANGGKCRSGLLFLKYAKSDLSRVITDEGFEGHFLNFYIYKETGKEPKYMFLDAQANEMFQLQSFLKDAKRIYEPTIHVWWNNSMPSHRKTDEVVKSEPSLITGSREELEYVGSMFSEKKEDNSRNQNRSEEDGYQIDISSTKLKPNDAEQDDDILTDNEKREVVPLCFTYVTEREDIENYDEDSGYVESSSSGYSPSESHKNKSKKRELPPKEKEEDDGEVEAESSSSNSVSNIRPIKKRPIARKSIPEPIASRSLVNIDLSGESSSEESNRERLILRLPREIVQSHIYINTQDLNKKPEETLPYVIQLLSKNSKVKSIKFAYDFFHEVVLGVNPEIVAQIITFISQNCQEIEELDFGFAAFRSYGINDALMTKLFQNCTKIQALNLMNCKGISDSTIPALLEHCPITRLNIANCRHITRRAFELIVNSEKKITHLDMTFDTSPGYDVLKKIVNAFPDIQHLRLGNCKITFNGCFQLVLKCNKLTSLDFGSAYLEEEVRNNFVRFMQQLPKLTYLNLPISLNSLSVGDLFAACKE
jgi:hypothetical protein